MRYVAIAPVYPERKARDAGTLIFFEYLTALADIEGLEIIVVSTAPAPPEGFTSPPATRVLSCGEPRRVYRRIARRLVNEVVPPFRLTSPFLRRALRDPEVRELLASADVVGLHWPAVLSAAFQVRALCSPRPISYFAHELLSDSIHGATRHGLLPRRIIARRWEARVVKAELNALAQVDETILLSQAERQRLEDRGFAGRTSLLLPYVSSSSGTHEYAGPEVLFVGALNRPENHEAALWLCNDIWPLVTERVRRARLTIVGASPARRLLRTAARQKTITVTGYVPDLEPYYARAAVCVAPIRRGGGVQVKVPQAMAYGVPVVATSTAWEGTYAPDDLRFEADTAPGIASLIVARLSDDTDERRDIRDRLRSTTASYGSFGEVARARFQELMSHPRNVRDDG